MLTVAGVLLVAGLAVIGYDQWRMWRKDRDVGRYDELIQRHAERHGLPADLVRSVIRAESSGNARAVSRVGARGLMQIMPPAEKDARKLLGLPPGPGDLFDPDYNVLIGTTYLRKMLNDFGGDVYLALAAYNWGPGKIDPLFKQHPDLTGRQIVERFAPPETRRYCRDVAGDHWDKLPVVRRP